MNDIQKLMLSMFIHVRLGVGIMGLLLPLILVFWGMKDGVRFAGSMSAYYHATGTCRYPECFPPIPPDPQSGKCVTDPNAKCTAGVGPMRNWFVGTLFFVGAAMIFLKGFSRFEDIALDIAGFAALCVALCPMAWPCKVPGFSVDSIHYPAAITFFVCAGFTCIFCSEKTLRQAQKTGKSTAVIDAFRAIYWILGAAMVILPVIAAVVAPIEHRGFWLEAVSVGAFGAYWLVKTAELLWSEVEKKALMGAISMNPHALF